MTESLFDLFPRSDLQAAGLFGGVAVGIVTNNKDPDGAGRVRVRFPWLSDQNESFWARVGSPMAGKGRGMFFLPEVDDEVLVTFLHGRIDSPVVIGCLWNGVDTAPIDNKDGKNNIRTIKSRSGHVINLDDTDGAEKIEIIDSKNKNKITIDSNSGKISINASGDISIESTDGSITLKGKSIDIQSTSDTVAISSAAGATLKASGETTIKGSVINLN